MLQRLVRHYRTEVRSADADVDDIADAFAGMAFPRSASHPIAEIGHLVEHRMHPGHHILSVYDDGCSPWGPQGDMQDRPLFRDIDLLAPEHGIDSRLKPGCFGELNQTLESFVRDSIFRIIQIDAQGFYC